jgi:uncharacterized protein YkwD
MKRKIISILLTVLTLNVYSQTDLESLLFQKINEYRVEKGLNSLKWDDATYKSTQVHTEYMIKNNKLSHTENSKTPSFTDRIGLFSDKNYIAGIENVNKVYYTGNSIDKISDKILSSWKRSKSHNSAMLSTGCSIGAVSCGDTTEEEDGYTFKIKYSTLVLWVNPD